ncbi:DNA-binding response regulator [Aliidongia dinghuensis]|uniref:Regulatory protein VirG n=2 Tax=Aliidongia dinghuensis TaxID=1867774 RepID=A0A8J2Z1D8_9PROT|nr:DNA-binding response regulator [Aliidongia dinghuensis]
MTSSTRLLIVDDDPDILSLLTKFFRKHSFLVTVAASGVEMTAALERNTFDLVILDLMLPGEDGLTLCRRLQQSHRVPVIMLTAMSELTDRIVGLEVGADDYVAKPFDARELLARVKAVLRRAAAPVPPAESMATRPVWRFAGWRLDLARRELRSEQNDILIPLTSGEFELLLAFVEHAQRVLTRDQLLDLAHGSSHEAYDRSIDLQVSRLRRKLESDARSPSLIRTVRNGGYMFTPEVERG